MAQRVSGYSRQKNDLYATPPWVTLALINHLRQPIEEIWEPAAGPENKIVNALKSANFRVTGSDISTGDDFLIQKFIVDTIVTNPPFSLAREFIEHALKLTEPKRGQVAMLLPVDYDSAKTRQHLFGNCPQFCKKLILTKRIVFFERPGAAPSTNHSWFLWSHRHKGPPTIVYDLQS